MRLTQNVILIILVCVLLSAILSIEGFRSLSFSVIKQEPVYNPNNIDRSFTTSNHKKSKASNVNIEIIWDISRNDKGEKNKLSTSRKLLKKIIKNFPDQIQLGISVYGTNDKDKTTSYHTVPISRDNRSKVLKTITTINPTGEFSINENLLKAKRKLKTIKGEKHILLVTDGEDTGNTLPEKTIIKLAQTNIKIHVVHIGKINKLDQMRLKTLAELGNGKYFTYLEEEEIVPTINLD